VNGQTKFYLGCLLPLTLFLLGATLLGACVANRWCA
jgi:hypothetical protein